MIEKLTEITESSEKELDRMTADITNLRAKYRFCREHKFEVEADSIQKEMSATNPIYYEFKSTTEKLRELVDSWNS